jgi:hypothetical protein
LSGIRYRIPHTCWPAGSEPTVVNVEATSIRQDLMPLGVALGVAPR